MARLPALISAYAELDGRPVKTIDWFARVARENGKIASTKRGAGAAHMDAQDAVNLILASNCADEAKDGPLAVEQFRSLRRLDVEGASAVPAAFARVVREGSLGGALEALIAATGEIQAGFTERLRSIFPNEDPGGDAELFYSLLGVDVTLRKFAASISAWEAFQGPRETTLHIHYAPDLAKLHEGFYAPEPPRHRSVQVTLSFAIFRACADLLAGNGTVGPTPRKRSSKSVLAPTQKGPAGQPASPKRILQAAFRLGDAVPAHKSDGCPTGLGG
jgi:hypothetical protein